MKRNTLLKNGYDQEEAYFHKEDQRLIEKQRRAKLSLVQNASTINNDEKKLSPPASSKTLKKAA